MALIKEHNLTDDGRQARRRNGQRSRGAATAAGKERSRAANLRHGIYSQERDQALRALGEDPADLAALIAGAYQQWRPVNAEQSHLVERVAHLEWRMDRAARRQESLQAQHLEKAAADRHEKTMKLRYHYVDMVDFLGSVGRLAARPDFHTTPGFIAQFTRAFGDEMQWRLNKILELLQRLRQPSEPESGHEPLPGEAASDGDWQMFLAWEAEEGVEDVPPPDLAIAEGDERAGLRQDLRYLAKQEMEAVKEVWDPFFGKYMQPMTLAERDCAVMEIDHQIERVRRDEESCSRLFWRTSNLLMKLQDRAERQSEVQSPESEVPRQESGGGPNGVRPAGVEGQQVAPNGIRPVPPACQNIGPNSIRTGGDDEAGEQIGVRPAGIDDEPEAPNGVRPAGQDNQTVAKNNPEPAAPARENAGASGDVDENKGSEKSGAAAEHRGPVDHSELIDKATGVKGAREDSMAA